MEEFEWREERNEPEASQYLGSAIRYEIEAQGPSLPFEVISAAIKGQTLVKGETWLEIKIGQRLLDPGITFYGPPITEYKITWIAHSSPVIAISLPAIAAVLAALGLLILATRASDTFWEKGAQAVTAITELPGKIMDALKAGLESVSALGNLFFAATLFYLVSQGVKYARRKT